MYPFKVGVLLLLSPATKAPQPRRLEAELLQRRPTVTLLVPWYEKTSPEQLQNPLSHYLMASVEGNSGL